MFWNCQIWEIHATSLAGLVERLHEFPKSDGFQTMSDKSPRCKCLKFQKLLTQVHETLPLMSQLRNYFLLVTTSDCNRLIDRRSGIDATFVMRNKFMGPAKCLVEKADGPVRAERSEDGDRNAFCSFGSLLCPPTNNM